MKGTMYKRLDWLKDERSALALLLGVGIIIRALFNVVFMGPLVWPDSFHYYRSALAIAENLNFNAHRVFHTPLYPTFLAFPLSLFGTSSTAGESILLAQQLMGLLSSALVYLIARTIAGYRSAFIAGLAYAVHSVGIFYELSLLTETLYTFWLLLLVYLLLRATACTVRHTVLIAILCVLLTLTRPVGQFFIVLAALYASRLAPSWKQKAAYFLGALALYALLMLPWCVHNYTHDKFVGISKGQGLNLFFRAFAKAGLEYPGGDQRRAAAAELYHRRAELRGTNAYFDVFHYYTAKLRSESKADQLMLHAALDAIKASPMPYLQQSAKYFLDLFTSPEQGYRLCSDGTGVQYPCVLSTQHTQLGPFRNGPAPDRGGLKKFATAWLSRAALPIGSISMLALVMSLYALRYRHELRAVALLFAGIILYHAVLVALFNVPEDRYRLPIDGLLLIFAAMALSTTYRHIGELRRRRLINRPPG